MNPFPLVFPCFYNPPSLYPFFCIRMAFLSCLSRLAKLLLGTLSLHLLEHLPLDSYESCANKHLFCGVLLHHFSNLSHRSLKSEDESHQSLCMCFTLQQLMTFLTAHWGPVPDPMSAALKAASPSSVTWLQSHLAPTSLNSPSGCLPQSPLDILHFFGLLPF